MYYCFTSICQKGKVPPLFLVHLFHPRVYLSATGVPPWLVFLHAGDNGQHSLWLFAGFDPLVELSVGKSGMRSRTYGQTSRKGCTVVPRLCKLYTN